MNLLTKSTVETEDKPFSTLNPTTRIIKYPERKEIILTDTVGFINELPQVLLKAFAATLEELGDASLLLHLVDISVPDFEERISSVEKILKTLDLEHKKKTIVFNKMDRIDMTILKNIEKRYDAVSISCLKKQGIQELIDKIQWVLATGNPTVLNEM
jgi:GTP-binding protein HflX